MFYSIKCANFNKIICYFPQKGLCINIFRKCPKYLHVMLLDKPSLTTDDTTIWTTKTKRATTRIKPVHGA